MKKLFASLLTSFLVSCLPYIAEAQTPNKKTIKVVRNPQEVLLSKEALRYARTYYYTDLEEALKEPDKVYKFSLHYASSYEARQAYTVLRNGKEIDTTIVTLDTITRPLDKDKIHRFFKEYAPLLKNLQSLVIEYPYSGNVVYSGYTRLPICDSLDIAPYLKQIKYLQEIRLENIDQLTISLGNIFDALASLAYFNSLSFETAYIYEIPKEILKINNLRELSFSLISFEDEPLIIYQLNSLEILRFIGTNLTQISQSIAQLKNLKRLRVMSNGYKYDYEQNKTNITFITNKETLQKLLPNASIMYKQTGFTDGDFISQPDEEW